MFVLQYDSKPDSPKERAKFANFYTNYKISYVWENDLILDLREKINLKIGRVLKFCDFANGSTFLGHSVNMMPNLIITNNLSLFIQWVRGDEMFIL